jgi:hypothetical protein
MQWIGVVKHQNSKVSFKPLSLCTALPPPALHERDWSMGGKVLEHAANAIPFPVVSSFLVAFVSMVVIDALAIIWVLGSGSDLNQAEILNAMCGVDVC